MTETLYRFRPVSRLLKDDGISGELDSQYLYFASADQLNDPLEGYKELLFNGDNIAWINLVRNYIQCLTRHCISMKIEGMPDVNLSEYVLDVMRYAPPEVVACCEKAIDFFMAEPVISQFIRRWPDLGEATIAEVFSYLDMVHIHALFSVSRALIDLGFFTEELKISEKTQEGSIKRIEAFTSIFSSQDMGREEKKRIGITIMNNDRENYLLERYSEVGSKLPESFYDMKRFPEKYCAALEGAVLPKWYVACFMEDCDDSSLWGSYGGNHKDVCLEFSVGEDACHKSLTLRAPTGYCESGVTWGKRTFKFEPVSYGESFVKVDFFNSFGGINENSALKYWYSDKSGSLSDTSKQFVDDIEAWRTSYWETLKKSSTVKTQDWFKEREFRLIQVESMSDYSDPSLRKLTYDFSSLSGIVFGIKTSIADKCRLINRIKELCALHKRSEFKFYQATYDHLTNKMSKIHLSRINVGYKGQ